MTAGGTGSGTGRFADLGPRIGAGLALGGIAVLAVWLGGWVAALFVLALALVGLWELHRMVTGDGRMLAQGLLALGGASVVAVALTATSGTGFGLVALATGGWVVAMLAPRGAAWLALGSLYMVGALCLLLGLRSGAGAGHVLWLVLVVAAADVGAYFAGRTYGGPKLWPAVSPGKTWSGALGGLVAAMVVGGIFALIAGWGFWATLAQSLVLGLASQAGDLLKSATKRRFGVKDASHLIPGHGGVLDRLDGIAGAAWAMGLMALLGGGFHG